MSGVDGASYLVGFFAPFFAGVFTSTSAFSRGSLCCAGTLTSRHGVTGLNLSVAHDSLHRLLFEMSANQGSRVGAGTEFALRGDTLHWNQELGGATCHATANVNVDSLHAASAIHGTLTCDSGDASFALKRLGK